MAVADIDEEFDYFDEPKGEPRQIRGWATIPPPAPPVQHRARHGEIVTLCGLSTGRPLHESQLERRGVDHCRTCFPEISG